MLPPQLSETWGAAYIQMIIALLIFFVGLPLIISQLAIPEEIRRIYVRYHKRYWIVGVIAIAVISALLLIWGIHPCPGHISPEAESIIISILVTILLLCFFVIYWKLYHEGRKALIDSIFVRCHKSGRASGSENEGSQKPLDDLTYLGEVGKEGFEKSLVLDKISTLIKTKVAQGAYVPHMFDNLLSTLNRIVLNTFKPGNENNFKAVLDAVKSIREFLFVKLPTSQFEIRAVDRTIGELCTECLRKEYFDTAILYLLLIRTNVDELLRVGINAIYYNKYAIAVSCLNDLEDIVEKNSESDLKVEDTYHLIALAAHIWGINEVARDRVEKTFSIIVPPNHSLMRTFLQSAVEEYVSIQEFGTAQKIENLMNDKFERK